MRLIIAGSRDLKPSFGFIKSCIQMFEITNIEAIISGDAEGVDSEGIHFASHMDLKVLHFKPNYDKYKDRPRYAPIARNKEMAKCADALLLIHNGSNGSRNMKKEMLNEGKPVYEVFLNKENNE